MRIQEREAEIIGTQGGTDAASPDLSDEWQASDAAQYRAVGSLLERETLERETASQQTEDLRHEVAGLRQALRTHPLIDTARGIVMATGSCSQDEAWHVLVDVSQRTNIKLREIAQLLVESITGPPPPQAVQLVFQAALDRMRADRS